MRTAVRTSTTDMEVTSIRFEKDLKDRLKQLAGNQGYQALIRDILWDYVYQRSSDCQPHIATEQVRATVPATARTAERCAMTGIEIQPGEAMFIGWTNQGALVPLSLQSLDA